MAVTGFQNLDDLRTILLTYGEFKTAKEVGLELPEPVINHVPVTLNYAQDAKYGAYEQQMRDEKSPGARLGLFARLSLVAIHADLDEGYDWSTALEGGLVRRKVPFDSLEFWEAAGWNLANDSKVSELAPKADDVSKVRGLAPKADDVSKVSGLAPKADDDDDDDDDETANADEAVDDGDGDGDGDGAGEGAERHVWVTRLLPRPATYNSPRLRRAPLASSPRRAAATSFSARTPRPTSGSARCWSRPGCPASESPSSTRRRPNPPTGCVSLGSSTASRPSHCPRAPAAAARKSPSTPSTTW
ncbi:hypothetical protein [Nannocystis pusilla]|uniref:hypothetical protein n=1 Tax=Nannocystis pusilla TaxID=889268 RepID=UPI003B7DA704